MTSPSFTIRRVPPWVLLALLLPGIHGCDVDNSFDPVPTSGRLNFHGDLNLNSQSDVDNFIGIRRVVGNLTIESWSITNLDGLADLLEVTGSLSIRGNGKISSVDVLANLEHVGRLSIYNCSRIKDLSPVARNGAIDKLSVTYCDSITRLPSAPTLAGLRWLTLYDLPLLTSLESVAGTRGLEELWLSELPLLTDLGFISTQIALKTLSLEHVAGGHLPNLSALKVLYELRLTGLGQLTSFADIADLPSLSSLILRECPGPRSLSGLSGLPSLGRLEVTDCDGLSDLAVGAGVNQTFSMDISACDGITDLTGLAPDVTALTIEACTAFASLAGVPDGTDLGNIRLYDLPLLTGLDALPADLELRALTMDGCPAVTSLAGLRMATNGYLRLHSLAGLTSLDADALPSSYQRLEIHDTGVNTLAGIGTVSHVWGLDLRRNPLTSLAGLEGVAAIGQELVIEGHSLLTDIGALSGLNASDCWSVRITQNPRLDTCAAEDVVATWSTSRVPDLRANGPCAR